MTRGYPESIRMDNGPEFISVVLAQWAEENNVTLEFIKPGKPTQNSFIERFNRTYRTEVLDHYLFNTLNEVREITMDWLREYNVGGIFEGLPDMDGDAYAFVIVKSDELEDCTIDGEATPSAFGCLTATELLEDGLPLDEDDDVIMGQALILVQHLNLVKQNH